MSERNNGLVVVDKPRGMTSFDVVSDVRNLADMRKVGHAGTLDPEATGVLPVALGRCTKLMKYMELDHKVYRFTVRLGEKTETFDTETEVVERAAWDHVDRSDIEAALFEFTGRIEQVPPKYSAVKVDGVPAHRRMRAGEDVQLDARPVDVDRLELEGWDPPEVTLRLDCGEGTYVRSLARDLSRELETVGYCTMIRRLEVGLFSLEDAVQLEELTPQNFWTRALSPLEMVRDLDAVELEEYREDIGHGRPLVVEGDWEVGDFVAGHDGDGRLLAVLECTDDRGEERRLWPRRVMV